MSKAAKIGTIFAAGLITVALATTLIKKNSNTAGVINAAGNATAHTLSAAQGVAA